MYFSRQVVREVEELNRRTKVFERNSGSGKVNRKEQR